jgi:hypothetical protein
MNWSKTLLGGVLAGVTMMLANFVMHGILMADTYRQYPDVFEQEPSSPAWFAGICVLIGIVLAVLFARTRRSWAAGVAGGAAFGLLVGMTHFFANFFDVLVYEGFPYYLSWCHGAMDAVVFTLAGVVLGLTVKSG